MVDVEVKDALLKVLDNMSLPLQRQVLTFASSLNRERPKGTPIRDLLPFAGSISREDAQLMIKAIEEGCEQVDPNGW